MKNSSSSSPTATASRLPSSPARLKQPARIPTRAYRAIVKRLNALAEVNGDTDYLEIINNLNNLIDRQKTILATRKTLNAKKAAQKPEGGGKPDDERPGEL